MKGDVDHCRTVGYASGSDRERPTNVDSLPSIAFGDFIRNQTVEGFAMRLEAIAGFRPLKPG